MPVHLGSHPICNYRRVSGLACIAIVTVLMLLLRGVALAAGPTGVGEAPSGPQASPITVRQEGNLYFLKVYLQDSRVHARAGLANDHTGGLKPLSTMKNRYTNGGYGEWGMVNGDYLSLPVGDPDKDCPSHVTCTQGLTYIDGQRKYNWEKYGTDYTNTSYVAPLSADSNTGLSLDPASASATFGDIFTLRITANLGANVADTVDAYVDFNPAVLQVVTESGTPATSIEYNQAIFGNPTVNQVVSTTGQINFSASKYDSPYLTGPFTVATIRFRAEAATAGTGVTFVRSGARWSDLLRAGDSLNPNLAGATVTISPPGVSLNGRVTLERRGAAGDPRWIAQLYRLSPEGTTGGIEIYQAGTAILLKTFAATTDTNGRFVVTQTGLGDGDYDIKIKSGDTLSNLKVNVHLPSGEIDFGKLLVGDSTGNDAVNEGDVSYMMPSFLLCTGDEGYRFYADSNKDGCVNGADVSALVPNFLKTGPIAAPGLTDTAGHSGRDERPAAGSRLALSPIFHLVEPNVIFTIDINADVGTGTSDTVDAYIDFNPAFLEVVDASGQPATSIEFNTAVFDSATYNVVSNTAGRIDFSASRFGSPYLSGTFRVATVRFRAKAVTPTTDVVLVRSGARWSDLLSAGDRLDAALTNSDVEVVNSLSYLPILVR